MGKSRHTCACLYGAFARQYCAFVEGRLRSRFIRTLIESMQVGAGTETMTFLQALLPERLRIMLTDEVMAANPSNQSVSLEDAEALLFEIDAATADGSGRGLENAGRGLAARILTEGTDGFAVGDLLSAARRLEAPLAQALVDASLTFEVDIQPNGFTLAMGVAGRPRFARLLQHVATGYIQSAATGTGSAGALLRTHTETFGDRGRLTVEYRDQDPAPTSQRPVPSQRRRPPVAMRAGGLAAEIERILGRSSAPAEPPKRERTEDSSDGD